MEFPSQITVSIKPDLYQSGLNMDMFKPGTILRLKVLELKGDRALIDFGKFTSTADVKIPVALGDELLVRVQEFDRQLKLNLLNPEQLKASAADPIPRSENSLTAESLNKILTGLQKILNQLPASQGFTKTQMPILNVLDALNIYFESFDLNKTGAEIVPRLKHYIENSGLFFEKLLESALATSAEENAEPATARHPTGSPDLQLLAPRDLKANLLMLRNSMENEPFLSKILDLRSLTILRHTVDALLTNIEQQHGRAVQRLDTAEPFQVFNFVLPLKDANQAAGLKVFYQKKSKTGAKKGVQICLLLSMDRLGDLRTDFYLLGKDLTVTFFVRDRPTKNRLQEHCVELQELLTPFFDQVLLRVIISENKIKNFDHEDIQVTGDRRVDLRI
jgi:hypothetical protein